MIYLDSAATSMVDPELSKIIYETMDFHFGNPSSLYRIGKISKEILDNARASVCNYLGCDGSVIFTGSGSEANTLALTGFNNYCKQNHITCAIYSSVIEHKSIMNQPCVRAIIEVDEEGFVDLDMIKKILSYGELLNNYTVISIQFANNEIGTIQDIQEIGRLVHQYRGGILHVDATQALPLCYWILKDHEIDMLTCSLHKWGMPKGIGFIWFRDNVKLAPIVYGGQQNNGIHGGTENIPYISAVPKLMEKMTNYGPVVMAIGERRDELFTRIIDTIPDTKLNGADFTNRLANNINISFKDVDGEGLLAQLNHDDIYVSAGSACNSDSVEPSYVLKAIGCPTEYIYGTIRITLDAHTTSSELSVFVEKLKAHVESQRELLNEIID